MKACGGSSIGIATITGYERRIEAPAGADFFESQSAAIAKERIRSFQLRMQKQIRARVLRPLFAERFDPVEHIEVFRIVGMAVGNQQIFITVKVHVHEHTAPGPIGGAHTGVIGNVGPSAITPIQKQGVPADLCPIMHLAWREHDLIRRGLAHTQPM